jgi:uncharacterized protein YkwD
MASRRRFLTLALAPIAGFLARGVPRGLAAPSSGSTEYASDLISASSYCPESEEQKMLALINAHRKANGKAALKLSRTLGAAAEHHSIDMAKQNYFSHTLANGTSWSTNIKNHGYKASSSIAENIAAGYPRAAETFTQWKNSSGHNKNMLSSSYKAIGIGRAYQSSATYDYYWTTTFGGAFDAGPLC